MNPAGPVRETFIRLNVLHLHALANGAMKMIGERVKKMPELLDGVHETGTGHFGVGERGIFALVNEKRLRRIPSVMLDEKEFLSDFGLRALSKAHDKNPYIFHVENDEYHVNYVPGDSDSGMFGGNSNWRGPIWMPTNLTRTGSFRPMLALVVEAEGAAGGADLPPAIFK